MISAERVLTLTTRNERCKGQASEYVDNQAVLYHKKVIFKSNINRGRQLIGKEENCIG